MLKLDRLKREAKEAAHKRGHSMKPFLRHGKTSAISVCRVCEMGVVVETRPAPNEIDIGGQAVALNCRRDSSMLRTDCSVCGNEMQGNRRCPLCGTPEGSKG